MSSTSSADATPRPRVSYVHHVSFRVPELEPVRRFYEDVLGCVRIPRPEIMVDGVWLQAGDVQIHLLVWPDDAELGGAPALATPLANHVAFHVEDFEAFREYLVASGYAPIDGPDPRVRQMVVQDPAGNVVEFTPAPKVALPASG